MSTLKVDNIRHNSATSDAITMASDGTCTAKLTDVGGAALSHRNVLRNGGMTIHQRGGNTTGINNTQNYFGADGWYYNNGGAGTVTLSHETDSPDGFSNSIKVVDLPELWCQTYKNLLGVEPKDVSEGVLQDIHWAMGAFGYFPTYSIGNIISTQLYYAAEAALECNLEEQFSRGDFKPLLGWLRENIHFHGRRFSTNELLLRSTGHDLSPSHLINHIKSRVTASYNL